MNSKNEHITPDMRAGVLPPITADEARTSDSEKEFAQHLFDIFFSDGSSPVFSLSCGGKKIGNTLKFQKIFRDRPIGTNGEKVKLTYRDGENSLTVTVYAELFYDECSFMFYAEAENTAAENSPVISDFYTLDRTFAAGKNADMYYLTGSDTSPDDFTLLTHGLSDGSSGFCADGGRPSLRYMPYFNICSDRFNAVLSVGWTGRWAADFDASDGKLRIRICQKGLKTYLLPGEKIRTPLVGLTPYCGKCTKGFNMFRRFVKNRIMPADFGAKKYYCVSGGSTPLKNSAADVRKIVKSMKESGLINLIDGFWFDAEHWYFDSTAENARWDNSVGSWKADKKKFPDGFSAVSDLLHGENCRVLQWYEPERMTENSYVYNEAKKNGWLLEKPNDNYEARFYLNLADNDACNFITKTILASLRENKIDIYRQDFNCIRNPSEMWDQKDGENRHGITENHYVTNLYRFIDALLDGIPGLVADNCAMGGQRLDLEMMHRSFPLWRSDYNCSNCPGLSEATQAHSAGISLFLPVSNASNAWEKDIYDSLSHLTPVTEVYYDFAVERPDECRRFLLLYDTVCCNFLKDFYLPFPADPTDKTWTAMQFGDENGGMLLAYRPLNAPQSAHIRFSGLDTAARYGFSAEYAPSGAKIRNKTKTLFLNGSAPASLDGQSLFADGISINLPPRSALILTYKKENS